MLVVWPRLALKMAGTLSRFGLLTPWPFGTMHPPVTPNRQGGSASTHHNTSASNPKVPSDDCRVVVGFVKRSWYLLPGR
jgi:hypothetical protein